MGGWSCDGSGGGGSGPGEGPQGSETSAADDIFEAVFTELRVKHFLKLAEPDMIFSVRLKSKLCKLKCSSALLSRLSACDLNWGVVGRFIDLPDLQVDDDVCQQPRKSTAASAKGSQSSLGHKWEFDGLVFFGVVSATLGQIKNKQFDNEQSLLRSDLALSLLRIYDMDKRTKSVLVSDKTDDGDQLAGHVLSYSHLCQAIKTVMHWEIEPKPHYAAPSVDVGKLEKLAASETLQALFSCLESSMESASARIFTIEKK